MDSIMSSILSPIFFAYTKLLNVNRIIDSRFNKSIITTFISKIIVYLMPYVILIILATIKETIPFVSSICYMNSTTSNGLTSVPVATRVTVTAIRKSFSVRRSLISALESPAEYVIF